ncbi:MAG: Ig-like domain-containing protein, partial [Candidatus Nanoarchaeia archaeon]
SILLILLILAVIAVVILAWKKVRIPLAVKLLAAALIVLIIMVVLVTQGFPESRAPAIDKTLVNNSNLVWHEDKSYEVELNSYFYDPDNDTMTFSVEDVPENITVEIDGNKATLTPDKDWSGTARIRFMATDGYGGEIESGRIDIEVVEVPEFSAVRMYMMNCVFWNALLLIIILALVFLLKTRKQEKEGTKKVHRAGIKKQKGFLYFVDKDGDVSRTPMARSNKKNQKFKKEKVGKVTRK